MWREIRISSLGVIADAALELDGGLTVITGETGAGKTMVVTALGLLRGQRSDATLVRHGDPRARVEAIVDIAAVDGVEQLVEDAGGEVDDGLILGRTVSAEGRSRAYAGGASVPASVLGTISDRLVAVHGQSDQNRLLRAAAQRAAVDIAGRESIEPLLAEYGPLYDRHRAVRAELAELTEQAQERARELDLLMFGLQEIEAVDPQVGEDLEVVSEENRLAHAETLSTAAAQAQISLAGDAASAAGSPDAIALVSAAQAHLDPAREHDPALSSLADRVAEIGYLLNDVAADLGSYAEGVEGDPIRLAAVQERRAALTTLTRKYGATLDEVLAWAKEAAARVTELGGDDERIASLQTEQAELGESLCDLAARLAEERRGAGRQLATAVGSELEALAMPHARLEVRVETPAEPTVDDLTAHGYDTTEILLAANAGAPALPLTKGASGGELSRVMLALEVVLADRTSVPTMVFDEVDAGIGGKAAVEVGRRLAMLARHAQVIAVTHLPQVAAFADRHYHVVKSDDGTVTTSGVEWLDDSGRVAELSRMLAGLEGSSTAEAHAQELLEVAREVRGPTRPD